jgi:hypothetical protein
MNIKAIPRKAYLNMSSPAVRCMVSMLLLIQICVNTSAQVLIELGRTTDKLNAYSGINVYGAGELKNTLTYDRIKGSPFLDDKWKMATLYDHQNRSFGNWPVRINLVSQEIHFLDTLNQERAIGAQHVQKIVFTDSSPENPSSVIIGGIPDFVKQQITCRYCYFLQCNTGHTILWKNIRRLVKVGDSLFGTQKRYYYHDEYGYYIQTGNQYHRLKKLNRDEFFQWIPGASLYTEWIEKENLRFKKENDFIRFLEHYNRTYRKDE